MIRVDRLKVWKVEVDGVKYRLAVPEDNIITNVIEQAVIVHNSQFHCSSVEAAVHKMIDTQEIVLTIRREE